jgi:hypothetical protein
MMMATCGVEDMIRVWEIASCKLLHEFQAINKEIVMMKFLSPYPMIATLD